MVLTPSKNFERVKAVIADLDKPVRQVIIKVLIAEVTHDKTHDVGADTSILTNGSLKNVLTNFGVWGIDNLCPKTTAGLVDCYVAAIPFFRNMLLGDLLYSALLFGALAFAENRFVRLREPAVGAA